MLIEYHFEIKYTKGTDNIRVDILSRRAELQGNEKPLGAVLRQDEDGLIRYNHPQLTAVHETPILD